MEIIDFIPELLRLPNPHHRPELGEVDHRGKIVRAEGDHIPLLPHDERPVLVGQMKLRQALLGELRLHLVGPVLGELGPYPDHLLKLFDFFAFESESLPGTRNRHRRFSKTS
jgi:hypothetical protein